MKIGFSASINVAEIDKTKLVEGKKGKYLNITCFLDSHNKDKFDSNGMITQSVSKEEREAGVKGSILGNAKVFFISDDEGKAKADISFAQPKAEISFADSMEDDIPW